VKSAAVVVVFVPCAMKSLPKRQKLVSEWISSTAGMHRRYQ
jgi:hypothetical protein